jgi:transcriptional regulator with XRE-family HTH domain
MEVAHPLRTWRQQRGISQLKAEEILGVGKPTISRIETWTRTPSLALAAKLSEKTGIPIKQFIREDA